MEWAYPLDGGRGRLTVRLDGTRAEVRARLANDGLGLYKCWLTGREGEELLLGTFLPEGEELRLSRSLDRAVLERAGVWPPAGGAVRRTFTFGRSEKKRPVRGPRGFDRGEPDRVLGDPVLRACGAGEALWVRKRGEQTLLLIPFRTDRPLPLVPAFCLMGTAELEGERWLTLRLDGKGWPVLPPPGPDELL